MSRTILAFDWAAVCGCAAICSAGSPPTFTEEAKQRGISFFTPHSPGAGHGMGLVDLDGDRDPDFICTGAADGSIGLYENDGSGMFADRADASGIPAMPNAVGVTGLDYNGDGLLDLYLACYMCENVLLRNEGGFQFTDVTEQAGVGDEGFAAGCCAADFNGDGHIDLYVANLSQFMPVPDRNRLYQNNGDGSFTDVAPALGLDFASPTWKASFYDFDRDGLPDLHISNDKGQGTCLWNNYLYRNTGGQFEDVTEATNTGVCLDSMGVAFGDFDGNGLVDHYCTNIPFGNPLLLNSQTGEHIESSDQAGVGSYATGWAAVMFDCDHDADLDLYVCNQDAPNRLYQNGSVWPCPDVAPAASVDSGDFSFCAVSGDVDQDGDLDLFVQSNQRHIELFINHVPGHYNWVQFDVVGRNGNTGAIGAMVDVVAAGIAQCREIYAGSNFKSQNEFVVHFGLAEAEVVDEIHVTWPGGTHRELCGAPTNARWPVYPTEQLGDANGNGLIEITDFQGLDSCFGLIEMTPACAIYDFDGDFDVDALDAVEFEIRYIGRGIDCNGNGQPDIVEVLLDTADDANHDGIPDSCQTCQADLAGDDGFVGVADLLALLGAWGPCDVPCPPLCMGDFNADCIIDSIDLLSLISDWGPCD